MKPAVQVPLAILVVAALVYIMYSQSRDEAQQGKQESGQVESAELEVAEEVEAEDSEEAAAYDAISDGVADNIADDAATGDQPDQPGQAQQVTPKQVSKDQADKDKVKRASLSLRERRRSMFKKIDVDKKDGMVSKEEHDVFFRNAFHFYDKNDDGRLTGYEINQVKRLPPKADVNKDGVLTRKEFLDQFERFFDIMDKDKSGDLTQKEFVR
jgi:hypothetical protein